MSRRTRANLVFALLVIYFAVVASVGVIRL
jgi:hypothetical protein